MPPGIVAIEAKTPPSAGATRQILEDRRYAMLATHNDDGSIHLTPVWYLFERGAFYVNTRSSDRKARNAASHPSGTIIVDVRRLGDERWVYAAGAVDLLQGEESRAINERIARRYLTDHAMEESEVGPAFAAADATICLTPAVWRTWSLRELDDEFFGGVLGGTPERWFRPLDV
jgi:nitroimidazol reductase NimA-like FMN-containing flavoprotein (pyridoxamine 5'-phosphate oxidase superfamily)